MCDQCKKSKIDKRSEQSSEQLDQYVKAFYEHIRKKNNDNCEHHEEYNMPTKENKSKQNDDVWISREFYEMLINGYNGDYTFSAESEPVVEDDGLGVISIRFSDGTFEIITGCDEIEWHDKEGYDELQFAQGESDRVVKIFHHHVDYIDVKW